MILEAEYKSHLGPRMAYAYAKVDITIQEYNSIIINWMDGQCLDEFTESFWTTLAGCLSDYPIEIRVLDFQTHEIDSSPADFRFIALKISEQFKENLRQ
jgi:hypothetical protein